MGVKKWRVVVEELRRLSVPVVSLACTSFDPRPKSG